MPFHQLNISWLYVLQQSLSLHQPHLRIMLKPIYLRVWLAPCHFISSTFIWSDLPPKCFLFHLPHLRTMLKPIYQHIWLVPCHFISSTFLDHIYPHKMCFPTSLIGASSFQHVDMSLNMSLAVAIHTLQKFLFSSTKYGRRNVKLTKWCGANQTCR